LQVRRSLPGPIIITTTITTIITAGKRRSSRCLPPARGQQPLYIYP
jgi:hypothetical protein